jgi:predicted metal-binding membrane protein
VSTIDSEPPAFEWRARLGSERAFLTASALLFMASAAGTIYSCKSMSGMPMPGGWTMSMLGTRMAGQTRLAASASFILMWVVMMLAMMLPSLVPMLLRYRRSLRERAETHVGVLTWITAAGYFLTWAIFGVVVYPLGVSLSSAEMQWPTFLRLVPLSTGVVLLLAGGFQLSPWKTRRLGRCRDTPIFGSVSCPAVTAWRHGLRLGADCSLCCIGFMIVMLVYDVMSLPAIFLVTAAITVERLAQNPERVARVIGALIMAVGLVVITRAAS